MTCVEVVLVGAEGETCLRSFTPDKILSGDAPPPPHSVLHRTLRCVATGEIFSPTRWAARLDRAWSAAVALERRVHDRVQARRFRPAARTTPTSRTRPSPRGCGPPWRARSERLPRPADVQHPDAGLQRRAALADGGRRVRARPGRTRTGSCAWPTTPPPGPDLLRYLTELPADPRIKLVRRRGRTATSAPPRNSAADLATGEFVALWTTTTRSPRTPSSRSPNCFRRHPDADLVYSDEDKIDAAGRRYDPQFKPDWSPGTAAQLQLRQPLHVRPAERSSRRPAGSAPASRGRRTTTCCLRVTELTDRVYHVPEILYHWRALPELDGGGGGR